MTWGMNFFLTPRRDRLRGAAELLVLLQVVVAARRDAPELLDAEGYLKHDVGRPPGVERELLLGVVVLGEVGLGQPNGDQPRLHQLIHSRWHCAQSASSWMKYSISICSNSRERKMKLRGVISLRNDFPIWAIPTGASRGPCPRPT